MEKSKQEGSEKSDDELLLEKIESSNKVLEKLVEHLNEQNNGEH